MKQIHVVMVGDDDHQEAVKAFVSKGDALEFSETDEAKKDRGSWGGDASWVWVVDIELVE